MSNRFYPEPEPHKEIMTIKYRKSKAEMIVCLLLYKHIYIINNDNNTIISIVKIIIIIICV